MFPIGNYILTTKKSIYSFTKSPIFTISLNQQKKKKKKKKKKETSILISSNILYQRKSYRFNFLLICILPLNPISRLAAPSLPSPRCPQLPQSQPSDKIADASHPSHTLYLLTDTGWWLVHFFFRWNRAKSLKWKTLRRRRRRKKRFLPHFLFILDSIAYVCVHKCIKGAIFLAVWYSVIAIILFYFNWLFVPTSIQLKWILPFFFFKFIVEFFSPHSCIVLRSWILLVLIVYIPGKCALKILYWNLFLKKLNSLKALHVCVWAELASIKFFLASDNIHSCVVYMSYVVEEILLIITSVSWWTFTRQAREKELKKKKALEKALKLQVMFIYGLYYLLRILSFSVQLKIPFFGFPPEFFLLCHLFF